MDMLIDWLRPYISNFEIASSSKKRLNIDWFYVPALSNNFSFRWPITYSSRISWLDQHPRQFNIGWFELWGISRDALVVARSNFRKLVTDAMQLSKIHIWTRGYIWFCSIKKGKILANKIKKIWNVLTTNMRICSIIAYNSLQWNSMCGGRCTENKLDRNFSSI